jgi:small subunit ribosomal protein S5
MEEKKQEEKVEKIAEETPKKEEVLEAKEVKSPAKEDKKMQFRTVTAQKVKTERIRPERIKEFEENVLEVSRVARVVKGGRRFKFRVAVVIGNKNGKVGVGIGKGSEVVTAVNKAVNQAKKDMIEIRLNKTTIPFDIEARFKSARIMLKPAPKGTGIIAGGAVRAVVDLAGVSDISSKMLGSANKINNMFATFYALRDMTQKIKAEDAK